MPELLPVMAVNFSNFISPNFQYSKICKTVALFRFFTDFFKWWHWFIRSSFILRLRINTKPIAGCTTNSSVITLGLFVWTEYSRYAILSTYLGFFKQESVATSLKSFFLWINLSKPKKKKTQILYMHFTQKALMW